MPTPEDQPFICPELEVPCPYESLCCTGEELNRRRLNDAAYTQLPAFARLSLRIQFCSEKRLKILDDVAQDQSVAVGVQIVAQGLASAHRMMQSIHLNKSLREEE